MVGNTEELQLLVKFSKLLSHIARVNMLVHIFNNNNSASIAELKSIATNNAEKHISELTYLGLINKKEVNGNLIYSIDSDVFSQFSAVLGNFLNQASTVNKKKDGVKDDINTRRSYVARQSPHIHEQNIVTTFQEKNTVEPPPADNKLNESERGDEPTPKTTTHKDEISVQHKQNNIEVSDIDKKEISGDKKKQTGSNSDILKFIKQG